MYDYIYEYLFAGKATYKETSEALSMPIGSIGPTRGRCLEHLYRIISELNEGSSLSDGTGPLREGEGESPHQRISRRIVS